MHVDLTNVVLQGELAVAFGELLRKIWSSGRTSIAPREFKGKLGRFAPQFSGYNQHDSQVSKIILGDRDYFYV